MYTGGGGGGGSAGGLRIGVRAHYSLRLKM